MQKLAHDNFIKARNYIFARSDDIDRAWFRYNFEGGDTAAFMGALAEYQREDGGFGGLAHEFEYQGSCLKCTEHAFRYIFYLKEKPSADHPVVRKMMRYVLERYRPEIGCWGELLEPGVNDGAHVRWWTYPDGDVTPIAYLDERIKKYNPNGEAALAAFVALYSEIVPEKLYQDIIKYPVEHILRNCNDIGTPYNLKCYQQFVKCLPDKPLADKLAAVLCQNPSACMQLDFAAWERGYEELPCNVVDTPDSVVYPAVRDLVDASLDYLIKQQSGNGAWPLTWRFGKDERFRRLEADYEAHLTMLILAELGRFGRI